jgi:hypothetical protein
MTHPRNFHGMIQVTCSMGFFYRESNHGIFFVSKWNIQHGSLNVPIFHITQPWMVYGLLDGYFFRWCPIYPSHGTVTPTPVHGIFVRFFLIIPMREWKKWMAMARGLTLSNGHVKKWGLNLCKTPISLGGNGRYIYIYLCYNSYFHILSILSLYFSWGV